MGRLYVRVCTDTPRREIDTDETRAKRDGERRHTGQGNEECEWAPASAAAATAAALATATADAAGATHLSLV